MKDAFLTTAILGSTTAPPPPQSIRLGVGVGVGLRRRIRGLKQQQQQQVHHLHLIAPQPLTTTVHLLLNDHSNSNSNSNSNSKSKPKSKREMVSLSSLSVLKCSPPLLPLPPPNSPPHHHLQLIPKILQSSQVISLTRLFILFLCTTTTQFAAAAAGAAEESSLTFINDSSDHDVFNKIWVESVVVGIDDFLNRYPFFVSTLTFIWLVALPLTRYYFFSNYKYVSALQAFQKLRDQPNCVLLDIRRKKIVDAFPSPNLKLLNNKKCLQVEYLYSEEEEDDQRGGQLGGGGREGRSSSLNNDNDIFVQKVKGETEHHPSTTILCIIDSFDGNSLKVAQLLSESGFKEAYAIKGGIQGKNGWQEIQEELLPSSLHVYPRKKRSKRSFMPPSNTGKQAGGITNENVGATSQKEEEEGSADSVKAAAATELEASPLEKLCELSALKKISEIKKLKKDHHVYI